MTEDKLVYRTKTSTGVIVPAGDTMELVRDDTPGVLYSIEVITDNAYAAIYLELDDYRTKEPGITAAELLMKDRTERNEDEFYALPRSPDGSYVVRFEPKEPIPYSSRLLVQVRNRIDPTLNIYGVTPNQYYAPRGGLPAPEHLAYTGGGFIKNANITSVHHNASAKFLRVNMDEYHSGIINTKPLIDNETIVGVSHPYAGIAGTVELMISGGGPMGNAGARLVIGSPGERVLPVGDAAPSNDSTDWPGRASAIADGVDYRFVDTGNSIQHIVIYPSAAEDRSAPAEDLSAEDAEIQFDALLFTNEFGNGDQGGRIFIKDGDTMYFPGRVIRMWTFGPLGGSPSDIWHPIAAYTPGTDGAILLEVQPGCPALPRKITLGQEAKDGDSTVPGDAYETKDVPTSCIGSIINENGDGQPIGFSGRFLVREATVKRKTLVSNT